MDRLGVETASISNTVISQQGSIGELHLKPIKIFAVTFMYDILLAIIAIPTFYTSFAHFTIIAM